MTLTEAIHARHSVRQYKDKALGAETISALQAEIDSCNRESGLHIQLVTNEPEAFDSFILCCCPQRFPYIHILHNFSALFPETNLFYYRPLSSSLLPHRFTGQSINSLHVCIFLLI